MHALVGILLWENKSNRNKKSQKRIFLKKNKKRNHSYYYDYNYNYFYYIVFHVIMYETFPVTINIISYSVEITSN